MSNVTWSYLRVDNENVDHPGEVDTVRLLDDVGQKLSQQVLAHRVYLGARVVQDVEQRVQELRQVFDNAALGDAVEDTDPGDQELPDEPREFKIP